MNRFADSAFLNLISSLFLKDLLFQIVWFNSTTFMYILVMMIVSETKRVITRIAHLAAYLHFL